MKTIINKSKFFVAGLLMISATAAAQLTLNCESGNRAIEQGNCWSFGATTYTNTAGLVIAGKWSLRSNSMSNAAIGSSWVKTPWINVGSGNITMKVKLENTTGTTKQVVVTYIPYSAGAANGEGTLNSFYTFDFPGTSNNLSTAVQTLSIPIPSQIADDATKSYKIQISFVGTGGNNRANADEIIIPGTYWSDPANNCLPKVVLVDTDGDGLADINDQYPNDIYRAYNNYYPAAATSGTLAFEDKWPSIGDYDFNDLVVDYNINMITNSLNYIVEILADFTLKASGAGYKNGFGFQIDGMSSNKILSSSGSIYSPNTYITLGSNGLEDNQTYANCIVFDNFYNVMPPVGNEQGVNTERGETFVPYKTVHIKLTLIDKDVFPSGGRTFLYSLPSKSFNFYMIANQQRGYEIHLPDRTPSSKVNSNLFGTIDDGTIETPTYKTVNNLPWGINIIQGFKYPIERVPLNKAYLHLIKWVETNGVEFPDWYDNKDGYRNAEEIY